jgi:hypothetical protein
MAGRFFYLASGFVMATCTYGNHKIVLQVAMIDVWLLIS